MPANHQKPEIGLRVISEMRPGPTPSLDKKFICVAFATHAEHLNPLDRISG